MHEYYFKIKKGDLEFEFSTTDKDTFEQKMSDWIEGVTNSRSIIKESPTEEINEENKPERKGFIEVRDLVKINDIHGALEIKPEENFENILEESMENPKIEVVEKTEITSPFLAYLSVFHPQNGLDYLILTAKYLSENEDLHRFSIKQLNAKLVPASLMPVDHSTIQEAVNQNLIQIVPNYTNMTDVTEYSLTETGEGYFTE